jgi:DNA-binding HxlR family transcriptional regulator
MELVCCEGNTDRSQCIELTDRESSVCKAICFSSEPVSFSQLKRSTQLHQEILSRIVRRLVIYGVVRKGPNGRYRKALT